MAIKFANPLRVLLVVIPFVFLVAAFVSSCGNDVIACDGTVNVTTASDCTSYGASFNCSSTAFNSGICTVAGCSPCEGVVDDGDPVVDVDDSGF